MSATENLIHRELMLLGPDSIRIYRVDGAAVRTYIDADGVGGWHGRVYRWMGDNEIWIEKMAAGRREEAFLLAHEMVEVLLMKYNRWTYETAHAKANDVEKVLRQGAESGWTFQMFARRCLGSLTENRRKGLAYRLNATYVQYLHGR